MTDDVSKRPQHRWWSWGGAAVGLTALAFVLARIDYGRFGDALVHARIEFLALVPVAIALEQLVRAWKWRQLLHSLRPVATPRLFGAIMAGYLGNLLIPPGVSPLLRSWLVARLERLKMSTVLATVAIDRRVDGVVFAILPVAVVPVAVFPDPTGYLRLTLLTGAAGTFCLFAVFLLWLFARYGRDLERAASWIRRLLARLPARFSARAHQLFKSFGEGIVWPAA